MPDILRPSSGSTIGEGVSEEKAKASSDRCQLGMALASSAIDLRRAARSSGDAFFLTSCSNRIAASKSTGVFDTKDSLEPWISVSFAVEPCLLRKHDNELDRELTLEFDLDMIDKGRPRPRGASSPTASSLSSDRIVPCSVSTGEGGTSFVCCRVFTLGSAYLKDSGESARRTAGEFVLVFGLDRRLW